MTTHADRPGVFLARPAGPADSLPKEPHMTTTDPQTAADTWNSRYPIGTPVTAYPGVRPEDDPNGERLNTRTRSEAQVLEGHTAVVWVDGHSACVSLTHVDPVLSADAYTPPAKYWRSDGAECCPHGLPVGPGSCEACWDLVKWDAVDDPAAVPAVPAAVPPTTQTADRELVAETLALRENGPASDGRGWFRDEEQRQSFLTDADAVLAVLPPTANRAAVLREAADAVAALDRRKLGIAADTIRDAWEEGRDEGADELRRLADEAQQQPDTETPVGTGTCGHRSSEGHPCTQPPGHFGYHRNARQGGNEWTSWVGDAPVVEEPEGCGAEPPEGWPGDCWCTLAVGHEGPHRCEPCSNRHDAPGWSDQPAAPAGVQTDEEA